MSNYIDRLKSENAHLQQLANYDELTQIYNRRATESMVKEAIGEGCAMFVCDLDHFKNINDKYGHLVGDQCLKKAAELLSFIMRGNDIVGRVGGDEFVIFASNSQNPESIERILEKISNRFDSYNENADIPIHITVGAALYQRLDSYDSMFKRADEDMLMRKRKKHAQLASGGAAATTDGWLKDIKTIRKELVEEVQTSAGAYCQDFAAFKTIYRFIERCMRRSNQKSCIVLFSFDTIDGGHIAPQDKAKHMAFLGELLMNQLRMGDVYTRYSSCQYLVLLNDVTSELAETVSLRVRKEFLKQSGLDEADILMHYCYQLKAARTLLDKPLPDEEDE